VKPGGRKAPLTPYRSILFHQVVRFLHEHGSPLEATTIQGVTPLIVAAQSGHVPTLRYLMQHGAK
jgi:ankyrin repeat protein